MGRSHVGNRKTLRGDNLNVVGNRNEIHGNYASVVGNRNEIHGDESTVTGNRNTIHGNGATVRGNRNEIHGRDCHVIGENNRVNGKLIESSGGSGAIVTGSKFSIVSAGCIGNIGNGGTVTIQGRNFGRRQIVLGSGNSNVVMGRGNVMSIQSTTTGGDDDDDAGEVTAISVDSNGVTVTRSDGTTRHVSTKRSRDESSTSKKKSKKSKSAE